MPPSPHPRKILKKEEYETAMKIHMLFLVGMTFDIFSSLCFISLTMGSKNIAKSSE